MDANQETWWIFNTNHLRTALERLDLDAVSRQIIELAEDQMPGAAWLDDQGNIHYAETMSEVDGLVLAQASEFDEDFPDEYPFWVASWLDEGFPDISDRLRIALAIATGTGTVSASEAG